MSIELSFDPNSFPIPGTILVPPHEVDVPSGLPNTLNNPDLTQVQVTPQQYWKVANGLVLPMTTQEQASLDSANSTALNLVSRVAAIGDLQTSGDLGKLERALVDQIVGEFNTLINWMGSLQTAIAASVSLSDLKARIALIQTPPIITLQMVKTAIVNEINAGTVD